MTTGLVRGRGGVVTPWGPKGWGWGGCGGFGKKRGQRGRVRDNMQRSGPPLKETGGPGTVKSSRTGAWGVAWRVKTRWLHLLPFVPGPYSVREAGGENPNFVTSASFSSHPCTCPWDFRVRLFGRSEEGPNLPHVPPRKILLPKAIRLMETERLRLIRTGHDSQKSHVQSEGGEAPPR